MLCRLTDPQPWITKDSTLCPAKSREGMEVTSVSVLQVEV